MPLPIDTGDENIRRGRRWLLPSQVDIVICFVSVFIFSMCFVILGAKILHPERLVPAGNNLFNYQANFLTRLHPALLYLYQLGIFCAFFGTIYGAYEVYFRTAFECLMPVSAWFRRLPIERFRRGIVLYCATLGLMFLWTLEKPIDIVTPAALIGGVFTCGLWCLAMLWADRPLPAAAAADAVAAVAAGRGVGRRAHALGGERDLGLCRGPDGSLRLLAVELGVFRPKTRRAPTGGKPPCEQVQSPWRCDAGPSAGSPRWREPRRRLRNSCGISKGGI